MKRGEQARRRERLARLFYQMTEGEFTSYPSVPSDDDMAARAVMTDALIASNSSEIARALRAWGRRRLQGTLLHQKIRRTIFGQGEQRGLYLPRKPTKKNLFVLPPGSSSDQIWIKLDPRRDLLGQIGDGRAYLIEIGIGYSSLYKLVNAYSEDDAIESAADRWPHLLLDELDAEEAEEAEERGENIFPHPTKKNLFARYSNEFQMSRARATAWGRVVDPDRRRAVLVKYNGSPPETIEYIGR